MITAASTQTSKVLENTAHTGARSLGHVVCLLGVTNNTNNYGVRVLLSGAVEALARNDPHVTVRILDYGRKSDAWSERTGSGDIAIDTINLRYSWRIHLPNNVFRLIAWVALVRLLTGRKLRYRLLGRNRWLKAIMEAKVCYSLAGGDSFSDIYGFGRLLYIALPQILALLVGRPLVQFPQTYGPFNKNISRLLARSLLRRSQMIWTRDATGVSQIRALLGQNSPPVNVMPDLGLLMAAECLSDEDTLHIREISQERPLVGLNVSKLLYMGGYSRNNMFGLKEDYAALTRELTVFLIDKLGATVLLIPHVAGEAESEESEITLNRQLLQEWKPAFGNRICFIDKALSHRQIKALIGHCDLFVGGRMHACIAAISQGVPTVALAYSDKFAGVFETIGLRDLVVDLRSLDAQFVLDRVARSYLQRDGIKIRLAERIPHAMTIMENLLRQDSH